MHVAAGGYHSLVRTAKGEVLAWGGNSCGQLGDGSTHDSLLPKRILEGGVRAVAAGRCHSLALTDKGSVLAWGSNKDCLLGTGPTEKQLTPASIIEGGAVALAAGAAHSLVLTETGEVLAWGDNKYGQLGDGSTSARRRPVHVELPAPARCIAAGWHHSLAATVDGDVYAWGFNTPDRTPPGYQSASVPALVFKGNPNPCRAVAAGGVHSFALLEDGAVVPWGGNEHGQLGDGTTVRRIELSAALEAPCIVRVAAGDYHSLAVTENFELLLWGSTLAGPRVLPAKVLLDDGIHSVAAGGVHSLAVTHNGEVYSWGGNSYGQLGDGTKIDLQVPRAPVLQAQTVETKTREEYLAEIMDGPAEVGEASEAPRPLRSEVATLPARANLATHATAKPVPDLLLRMTGAHNSPGLVRHPATQA